MVIIIKAMRFLLCAINAKYIHSNPAVYSLKAYCGKKYEKNIVIAEYTINHTMEQILAGIYENKPDVIGISCYIWNFDYVCRIIEEIPKILPGVPIWLGGPEVSYDGEMLLQQKATLKGIMIGEGEVTFSQLMEHYVEGSIELSDIAGILYRDEKNEVHATAPRALTNLSEIPFLYEDMSPFENRIIYYETSRGCPYRCSYCLSSIDKTVRLRDLQIVKRELQFFLDKKVSQVKFVDRTFNCNREHAMEIWKYLIDHDNGITNFHFEIEADIITKEQLSLLKTARPGLMQMEIGVQTANSVTLKEIRRTASLEGIRNVVSEIRSGENIHIHLDLIAGLPFEDYKSFGESFNAVYAMEPEQLQLGFLKVLKGAYMHEMADTYGIKYLSTPPYEVLSTNWIRFDEIRRLKRIEEMVELYYNSNQYINTLKCLVQEFDSPFSLYETLSNFYLEKGYFVTQPARSYRYQVLLDFIMEAVCEDKWNMYRELLTYDLYLRENCKSRPSFCNDLASYKQLFKEFYYKEQEERHYLPTYEGYDSKQMSKMTHVECFHYPVWNVDNLTPTGIYSGYLENASMILFDYQDRNPLNSECKTIEIKF